jgi:hypothetical protein
VWVQVWVWKEIPMGYPCQSLVPSIFPYLKSPHKLVDTIHVCFSTAQNNITTYLVIDMGNLWVNLSIPVPIPTHTPTHECGYRFSRV